MWKLSRQNKMQMDKKEEKKGKDKGRETNLDEK